MKPDTANPVVSRFWRPVGLDGTELAFTSCARFSFPKHFHDEYVIALMVRGVERLRHRGGNELAPEDSLILVNPGQVHENSSVNDAGFAYWTLYVPVPLVARMLSAADVRSSHLPGFSRAVISQSATTSQLRQLHQAIAAGEPAIRVESLLFLTLSTLFQRYASVTFPKELPPTSARTIALVKEYLDAHAGERISLEDIGRLAGVSPYHLARCFRDAVGLAPGQYLIQRRILLALVRLRQGAPISSAALEAGLSTKAISRATSNESSASPQANSKAVARSYKTGTSVAAYSETAA
jgi:AraC-like DNA-binding protein